MRFYNFLSQDSLMYPGCRQGFELDRLVAQSPCNFKSLAVNESGVARADGALIGLFCKKGSRKAAILNPQIHFEVGGPAF
jgi:hypothetical protein